MIRGKSTALAFSLAVLAAPCAMARIQYVVETGIQYRETTHVTQRPITEYKYAQPQQDDGSR